MFNTVGSTFWKLPYSLLCDCKDGKVSGSVEFQEYEDYVRNVYTYIEGERQYKVAQADIGGLGGVSYGAGGQETGFKEDQGERERDSCGR